MSVYHYNYLAHFYRLIHMVCYFLFISSKLENRQFKLSNSLLELSFSAVLTTEAKTKLCLQMDNFLNDQVFYAINFFLCKPNGGSYSIPKSMNSS